MLSLIVKLMFIMFGDSEIIFVYIDLYILELQLDVLFIFFVLLKVFVSVCIYQVL